MRKKPANARILTRWPVRALANIIATAVEERLASRIPSEHTPEGTDREVDHHIQHLDLIQQLIEFVEGRCNSGARQRRRQRPFLRLLHRLEAHSLSRLQTVGVLREAHPKKPDPRRHDILGTQAIGNIALDGLVSDVLRHGYARDGKTIRPACVIVFAHEPQPKPNTKRSTRS